MPQPRHELRALLDSLLRSDADFDAFTGDRFAEVTHRFTDNMDRVRKTNLLLQHADLGRLTEALQGLGKSRFQADSAPAGRIKILFLASNPTVTTELHLAREARAITERLGVGKPRERFELVTRWAVRRGDLQRLLLEENPHVLHFSSHGSTRAQLLLEDDDGNAAPVDKKALVELVGILGHRLQLVVLNACNTEPLAKALVQHVACAIGMRQSIDDAAAVAFATSFYQALAHEKPIETAFRLACNELKLQNISDDQAPILAVKQGIDATTRVLTANERPV